MLEVTALEAAYGESQVLFGVTFAVAAGEVVTLLGRNGMGKTTTVSSVMGLLPAQRGAIREAAGGGPAQVLGESETGVVEQYVVEGTYCQ